MNTLPSALARAGPAELVSGSVTLLLRAVARLLAMLGSLPLGPLAGPNGRKESGSQLPGAHRYYTAKKKSRLLVGRHASP
jgi:hypothetical protein